MPARKHITNLHTHSPSVDPSLSPQYCWSTGWSAAPGIWQGGSSVCLKQWWGHFWPLSTAITTARSLSTIKNFGASFLAPFQDDNFFFFCKSLLLLFNLADGRFALLCNVLDKSSLNSWNSIPFTLTDTLMLAGTSFFQAWAIQASPQTLSRKISWNGS